MRHWQRVMVGMALATGFAGCGAPTLSPRPLAQMAPLAAKRATFVTITVEDLHAIPAATRPALIDVREPDEFAAGHVPGAVNVPLATVAHWADSQPPSCPLLVICHSGRRSAIASQTLVDKGFTHVTNVGGGTAAWIAKGYPLEKRSHK